jgi:hypothetical protein
MSSDKAKTVKKQDADKEIAQSESKMKDADTAIAQSESGNNCTAELKSIFNDFYVQVQHDHAVGAVLYQEYTDISKHGYPPNNILCLTQVFRSCGKLGHIQLGSIRHLLCCHNIFLLQLHTSREKNSLLRQTTITWSGLSPARFPSSSAGESSFRVVISKLDTSRGQKISCRLALKNVYGSIR